MWGICQAVNQFILITLLIAIMNNTIQVIQKQKINEWKFARTEIWLKVFDQNRNVPPPFNLLEILIRKIRDATRSTSRCSVVEMRIVRRTCSRNDR